MEYPPTLLLRIYGTSSDALISREEELRILYVLSTAYGLGPKVYGTFGNGRVEQFFPSRALTAEEMRTPDISQGIARRMRELHSVDLGLLGYETLEPMVWKCLSEWLSLASSVLQLLAGVNETWSKWSRKYDVNKIRQDIQRYRRFVENDKGKGKGVVFARKCLIRPLLIRDNDTQYGNLLKLDVPVKRGVPKHHQVSTRIKLLTSVHRDRF
jgi:choline kinase